MPKGKCSDWGRLGGATMAGRGGEGGSEVCSTETGLWLDGVRPGGVDGGAGAVAVAVVGAGAGWEEG